MVLSRHSRLKSGRCHCRTAPAWVGPVSSGRRVFGDGVLVSMSAPHTAVPAHELCQMLIPCPLPCPPPCSSRTAPVLQGKGIMNTYWLQAGAAQPPAPPPPQPPASAPAAAAAAALLGFTTSPSVDRGSCVRAPAGIGLAPRRAATGLTRGACAVQLW